MFRDGLARQSEASTDGGGKLGLVADSGVLYYAPRSPGGSAGSPRSPPPAARSGWRSSDRGLALVLVPAPLLFLLFMGLQDRFFARWLLPVYPLLCLLAASAALEALRRVAAPALVADGVLLCAQGLVFAVHNDLILSRPDTRALARDWMVANVPEGTKVVIEPIAPDQWAMDVGHPSRLTRTGHRWAKWRDARTSAAGGSSSRTTSARSARRCSTATPAPATASSSPARTQQGRALREPDAAPEADRLLPRARAPRARALPRQPD